MQWRTSSLAANTNNQETRATHRPRLLQETEFPAAVETLTFRRGTRARDLDGRMVWRSWRPTRVLRRRLSHRARSSHEAMLRLPLVQLGFFRQKSHRPEVPRVP